MKVSCLTFVYVCAIGTLVGCHDDKPKVKKYEFKMPEIKVPTLDPDTMTILKTLKTCDSNETEMQVTAQMRADAETQEGTVQYQATDFVDCSKKVTSFANYRVKGLDKTLEILPPSDLRGPIESATIKNRRTCDEQKFMVKSDQEILDFEKTAGKLWPGYITAAGYAKIRLESSTVKHLMSIAVNNGPNVFEITYQGPCAKWETKNDRKTCVEAPVLGQKVFLLNMKITTETLPGKITKNACIK